MATILMMSVKMANQFYTRVAKELKLKVRKFRGIIPTFIKVTWKKWSFLLLPPSSILNRVKSRKAVMEFFLSFKSFKSRKKVTNSFFIGHASLSFHLMHKFSGIMFSLSVPNEFLRL